MPVTISALTGAVGICVLYYIALDRMDKKGFFMLERKNRIIASKRIYVIGALTAAGWMAGYIRQGSMAVLELMLNLCLIWGMAVLSVIDMEKRIVPNWFLKLLFFCWSMLVGIAIIFDIESGMASLFQAVAGALTGGVIFLLCYLLSRKQLGAGDVKLAFIMGLYLTGQRIVGAIFYGVLLCCIYSVIQLCRKKVGMKDEVPLVPFLYMGVLITLLIL